MKNYNVLKFILLASFMAVSCKVADTEESYFSFNEAVLKAQYTPKESVKLSIIDSANKKIDSIVYSINNLRVGSVVGKKELTFPLKDQKLGYQNLKASVYFEGKTETDSTRIEVVSDFAPKVLTYTIVNTYPHDINSYTEGLEFYKDTLYESVGQYGTSRLLKTDYKTGKILKSLKLEDKYFGEGLTILNDKIYLLTYKEHIGFIYDAKTWKLESTFVFDKPEGWGMTNDGKNIYFNDSSEKIWTMDPSTQKTIDNINVYSENNKIKEVNEMEWVDGKIYSNIYLKKAIVIINPKNGAVEAMLDMSGLEKKITQLPDTDVLNGIAYNPKTKTFFVTGKNWDKMFEIRINQ
ncbi:glutaminyl-peptide cyclotransferase [Flavobacterium sp.]|uniref:glutaminyl-peptide cyclotransferase n=1 Tax=Flavobacterium sp. TaxID=239 RepID=UPI0038D0C4E1